MRQLNWDLKLLEREAKDGSRGKRRDRSYSLALMANTLHDLGFKGLRAPGLKEKHVQALVGEWNRQGLSTGTMANGTAHVRWWARRIGRPGVVRPSNAAYGMAKDSPVAREDRSRPLVSEKLAMIADPHVRMSLRLQDQFGLRREEAMKFQPRYADRGDRVVLKASWCKGGRTRWIPVLTDGQRRVLDEARRLVGSGSLIPAERSYRRQLRVYEREVAGAGMARMHGLRHGYAIRRYEHLTGWKAPVRGGPSRRDLDEGAPRSGPESTTRDFPRTRTWPRIRNRPIRWLGRRPSGPINPLPPETGAGLPRPTASPIIPLCNPYAGVPARAGPPLNTTADTTGTAV